MKVSGVLKNWDFAYLDVRGKGDSRVKKLFQRGGGGREGREDKRALILGLVVGKRPQH